MKTATYFIEHGQKFREFLSSNGGDGLVEQCLDKQLSFLVPSRHHFPPEIAAKFEKYAFASKCLSLYEEKHGVKLTGMGDEIFQACINS